MYLTDFRENTLQDVITKLEPDLFLAVTGLPVKDFHLPRTPQRVQYRADEPGGVCVPSPRGCLATVHGHREPRRLTHYGLYDTVVGRE